MYSVDNEDSMALRPSFREDQVLIIQSFLRHHWEESGRVGVVLGMSGGLDSSVVAKLCAEAIGPTNVLGLAMPLEAKESQDEKDARSWAGALGINFRSVRIGPMTQSVTQHLAIAPQDLVGAGNVHARVRMITLYQVAHGEHRLVIGTGNKSELLTGYFCYDSKTRAMTPNGPVSYADLRPGDTVFSMDLGTKKVLERPIQAVHVFPYGGEMLHIKHRRLDLLVTPNHRLLISRYHGRGPLGFETAESRLNGGVTSIPIPEAWDGEAEASPVIDTAAFLGSSVLSPNSNPPVKMATPDFLHLMGLFIGDGTNDLNRVTVPVKSALTAAEYQRFRTPDGRFAALPDGPTYMKTYERARIWIASSERNRSRRPLIGILRRYDIHPVSAPTMVGFTNRALSAAFLECGLGARNKCIPPWVMKLPASQLRYLFIGLMESDGNADGSAYNTISPRLAYQMIELCAKLGIHAWARLRPPKTTEYKGKIIRSQACYEVRMGRKSRTLTFRPINMRRVSYMGKVWCPSVPRYENLLVERNGKTVFCGNTKFGDGGSDFLPLGDLYKTQIREMAPHLGVPPAILEKVPSAGLWEGQSDEKELGIAYEDLDRILLGLELEMSLSEIADRTGLPEKTVEGVDATVRRSVHKRRMPLIPKVGIRTFGLDWRE